MKIKKSVTINGTKPEIYYAIGLVEGVYAKYGKGCVVTSLTDSHSNRPSSLHNRGFAADFRIKHVDNKSVVLSIFQEVNEILNPQGFDVVLEDDHIHVEFQPKGNEAWIHRVD